MKSPIQVVTFFRIFFLGILMGSCNLVHSQESIPKGVPLIQNYSPSDYLDAGKIWDIESAPNGMLYMASDNGLLEFDGKDWAVFQGSQGITRSLVVQSDSVIFTGSDLDFGRWSKKGRSFVYQSLYPFKKEVQDGIEEFWHTFQGDVGICFISTKNIFVLNDGQLTKISAPSKILTSFKIDEQIYIFDQEKGLMLFENLKFAEVYSQVKNLDFKINGLYHSNATQFVVTENDGICQVVNQSYEAVNSNLSVYLKGSKVFSFEMIDDKRMAIGTVLNGLVIADTSGQIIHLINRFKGLQNNTILSLHYSPNGKLWTGLDYGLSSIHLENEFTYFYDFRGDFGSGYTAHLIGQDFYLGTNQGLYHSKWDNLSDSKAYFSFDLIPETDGQVWNLTSFGNELLVAHDKGFFSFKAGKLKNIDSRKGIWDIKIHGKYLIAGTYDGIFVYHRQGKEWVFLHQMDSIIGSCTQILFDKEDKLWINIANYAIVQIDVNKEFKPVDRKLILLYDSLHKNLRLEKHDGKIFIKNKNVYISGETVDTAKEISAFSNQQVPNDVFTVYSPKHITQKIDFFPIHNGFALRELGEKLNKPISGLQPQIKRILALSGQQSIVVNNGANLKHRYNNIRISFISPNLEGVMYQYRLHSSASWSELSSDTQIELLGLSSGKYAIEIRAVFGEQVSDPTQVHFTIIRPFALSWQAFLIYLIIAFILIFFIRLRYKRVLEKQGRLIEEKERKRLNQLTEDHRRTIAKLEREKLEKDNEQLKGQLRAKTVELANKAKDNEAKNKLFSEFREKFVQMREDSKFSRHQVKELIRMTDTHISKDDHIFEIQMDELHQEFFRKLKLKYPSLSSNDLRICAYLKVGLNSKEIADIMNIQLSSSYITRSRIRKKLGLDANENLYDFLNSI